MIGLELNEVVKDTHGNLYLFSHTSTAAWACENYVAELAALGIKAINIRIASSAGSIGMAVSISRTDAPKLIDHWRSTGELPANQQIPTSRTHNAIRFAKASPWGNLAL